MTDDELIDFTNKTITELVYPKYELQKAYNYYNGKRDAEQFRYLEENYGIGNPTSVEFIPLIRKHLDALIGEYLGAPILPRVTCKDSETISKINREKQFTIAKNVQQFLLERLHSKILESIKSEMEQGDQQQSKPIEDPLIRKELSELIETLQSDFISQYESSAQHVVDYLMQSRETDFKNKLKTLLLDLLITGYNFYRTKPSVGGNNVVIEILNPLNTFIDRNPESPYVKDSYRVVIRKWMTKSQILNLYGKQISKSDRELLEDAWHDSFNTQSYYVRSSTDCQGLPSTEGLKAGDEVAIPGYPTGINQRFNYKLIPVYEVEWLETDKHFVMQRYKTTRIGESIYILTGLDDTVVRSHDNPNYCSLSVNGLYFVNRDSEPYSMVLACAALQDKYDLLHFYRDNLIANSGGTGDWVDVSTLPKFLGTELAERLQKWIAYKKGGIGLLDSSQEGRIGGGVAPNTIYNGFDDTVRGDAIQAIQLAIDAVENTCSSITGVFRERLNGIQQRDAVTNVQTSVNNSYIISKQWYQQMDTITEEIILDALNQAKIVFKSGLTGVLILGDRESKVFTALPEYFTISDYDIHITSSSDATKDVEQLKTLIPNFIQSNTLEPELIIDTLASKSISDVKRRMKESMRKKKQENDQLQQALQKVQQLEEQTKQLEKQLKQAQGALDKQAADKLKLDRDKMERELQIEMYKAETERTYKQITAKNDTDRTQIELEQLRDGNPYNDQIRNER